MARKRRKEEERKKRREEKKRDELRIEEEGKRKNAFFHFTQNYIQYFILVGIIVGAITLRWVTADFHVLLDADPWWFYRHAEEIYNNNFEPPRWDLLSYYPPGRPVDYYLGWSYTLAIFYSVTHPFFPDLTLMKFSGLFVPIFASLSAIPAYFVGTLITNRWGGLLTAFLAVISPVFMAVSMAGYPDSDSVVIFYTFLAVLTTIYAIKKAEGLRLQNFHSSYNELIRYLPHLLPSIIAFWLFAVSWNFSWYIYYIFLFFIPLLILFRFLEAKIFRRQHGYLGLVYEKIRESRSVAIPIVLIGFFSQLISSLTYVWPYNTIPLHQQLVAGLIFLGAGILEITILTVVFISIGAILGASIGKLKGLFIGAAISAIIPVLLLSGISGERLIVNQAIAELLPFNLFSSEGSEVIFQKIGSIPAFLGIVGLIGVMIFKLVTKREIRTAEYFALAWIIISMALVNAGARFSLLATIALATGAGFMLGNLVEFFKGRRKAVSAFILYGLIIIGVIFHANGSFNFANRVAESAQISQEWVDALTWLKKNADKDALVVTWWDAGHFIAAFTGLRVHSDGAHCPPGTCFPYDHDIRIVEMGRIFTTTDENESIGLLQKYVSLSSEQCQKLRNNFGNIVPADACGNTSEILVVASIDLIGKYGWISYFGSFDYESGSGEHRSNLVLPLSGKDRSGNLVYGSGEVTISKQDGEPVPFLELPYRGISNRVISQMVYFDEGEEVKLDHSRDVENTIEGLLWVAPNEGTVIFMEPEIADSIFTKLFFFEGRDLQHFEQVFGNSDVKIFKVNLE
ncbi:MAG: STT3 domain-containing protein [Nitrososphaerales archaeon]